MNEATEAEALLISSGIKPVHVPGLHLVPPAAPQAASSACAPEIDPLPAAAAAAPRDVPVFATRPTLVTASRCALHASVATIGGAAPTRPGDWIVRNADGTALAVLDDATFRAAHTPVNGAARALVGGGVA